MGKNLSKQNGLNQKKINQFLLGFYKLKSEGVDSIEAIKIMSEKVGIEACYYFAVIGLMNFKIDVYKGMYNGNIKSK